MGNNYISIRLEDDGKRTVTRISNSTKKIPSKGRATSSKEMK